jgi:hypothetical protein
VKKIIKKSAYVSVFLVVFSGIISCEKDFTDIGTTIITNNVFSTDKILVDIELENKEVDRIRTDNINLSTGQYGQYLLGVYNNASYEKLEASILSQVQLATNLQYTDETYGADTTVVSTIDTVFLKLPYQATLTENDASDPTYSLDSIFGDQEMAFTLNLYQSDEYLSTLDLEDPTQISNYFSDEEFLTTGSPLNSVIDYQFTPNKNDTTFIVKRRLSDSNLYDVDTIKITTTSSDVPLPFARIPMDEAKFKTLFFDKYESAEFSSQDAFNNYFRGLILEATGDNGALISFDFNNRVSAAFNPSIEVYYTNTVLIGGTQVFDTIKKSNSFPLSGIRRSLYKMGSSPSISNEQIKIQGTAGSEGSITLFGAADTDDNGVPDQLDELRLKNILVNDALLTIYIDQSVASDFAPERLYLYKDYVNPNSQAIVQSHLKDVFTGASTFGGSLETDDDGKMKYTFRIPDYISELLNSETDYNPKLSIKALNTTDLILNDTIFRPYNWNPKMVTLLNESSTNGDKKAELKISYSKKEN